MAKPVRTVTSSCGIVIVIVSGDRPRRALHAVLSTDLSVTPPLHDCGLSWDVLRQDQSKFIGDCVGVRDCEADAGSRKIEDSAPPKQGTLYSDPGIIVVPATRRSTAIIVIDAQMASDSKSQATLVLTPGQSLLLLPCLTAQTALASALPIAA
jgi:hypothetical protein